MSTSPRPDEPVGRLFVEAADNLGDRFTGTTEACRAAVAEESALRYLAHFTSGVFDLAVDLFGDPPPEHGAPPGNTRRDELRLLGRQVSAAATYLARLLPGMETGRLLRTTLQTSDSSVICESVLPSENVVAVVPESPPEPVGGTPRSAAEVRAAAAKAVGQLTKRLRDMTSAPPIGFTPTAKSDAPGAVVPSAPKVICLTDDASALEPVITACRRAVDPADLQVVVCWSHGGIAAMVDLLDHPSLAGRFGQTPVDTRRKLYTKLTDTLCTMARKLNRSTATAPLCGRLDSMAFDVELGAIYCNRFGPGEYLVGVALGQQRTSDAGRRMSDLTAEIANTGIAAS